MKEIMYTLTDDWSAKKGCAADIIEYLLKNDMSMRGKRICKKNIEYWKDGVSEKARRI